MTDISKGGQFSLGDKKANRMGYGAMQLAGPHVFGPPADRKEAIAVLREAVDAGVNHIDTSDFYGPHLTNEIIREALHPYQSALTIVTKVGVTRGSDGSWNAAQAPDELVAAVHDNLRNLGLDVIDVVNLRVMAGSNAEIFRSGFEALARLQSQGLIRHLGLSGVNADQVAQAQAISPIVCVQNEYNVVNRADDALIDALAAQNIAYVPFFPLGGFSPIQSEKLTAIAMDLNVTARQVALAWLLSRSPNILLIPGTSKLDHLRHNLMAAELTLTSTIIEELEAVHMS